MSAAAPAAGLGDLKAMSNETISAARPSAVRARRRSLRLVGTASILALGVIAGQAQAADAADADTVTEVVVTAARRGAVSVQDTPLAVTAFSGEQLQKQGITSLQDLTKIDPSLSIQSYGASQTKVVIRGIESNVGATSGVYLDETPLVGGLGGNILGDGKPGLRLIDLDHIEVLKGPQGTLFGSGSMSGTLRVITRKPDLGQFGGAVSASAAGVTGGDARYEGSATLNVPIITDQLGVRITAWGESGGGYIDQSVRGVMHKNNNNTEVKGVRAVAQWKPLEALTLTGVIAHQEVDVDGTQAWLKSRGAYDNSSPTIEFYNDDYNLYSLSGEYDLGFGKVTATVSNTNQGVMAPKDSTPTANGFGLPGSTLFVPTVDFEDTVGELRFSSDFDGPFQLVTGAFYENSQSTYQTNAIAATTTGTALCFTFDECVAKGLQKPGRGQSLYEFGTRTKRGVGQYALYAQGDYAITPTLKATLGIRYFEAKIHDTVTNLQTVFPDYAFGIVTRPSITGDNRGKNTNTSYNASILWEMSPDVSFYARAASGFRLGGVNTATSLAQQAGVIFPGTYKPDSLWNYEAGVKSYWFERTLYTDIAFYHIDWMDQQLSAQAPGAFAYTINAGKTTVDGLELNATYTPTRALTLGGSLNLVKAKLDEDLPKDVLAAGTFGYKGDRVPLTPKVSMTLHGEYEQPIAGDLNGYVGGSVTYRGVSWTSFNNTNRFNTKLPDYALFSAKIGLRKGPWDIALFGDNLTNKAAYLGVVESLDGIRVFSPRPRTIGLRASSTF